MLLFCVSSSKKNGGADNESIKVVYSFKMFEKRGEHYDKIILFMVTTI